MAVSPVAFEYLVESLKDEAPETIYWPIVFELLKYVSKIMMVRLDVVGMKLGKYSALVEVNTGTSKMRAHPVKPFQIPEEEELGTIHLIIPD